MRGYWVLFRTPESMIDLVVLFSDFSWCCCRPCQLFSPSLSLTQGVRPASASGSVQWIDSQYLKILSWTGKIRCCTRCWPCKKSFSISQSAAVRTLLRLHWMLFICPVCFLMIFWFPLFLITPQGLAVWAWYLNWGNSASLLFRFFLNFWWSSLSPWICDIGFLWGSTFDRD